MERRNGSIRIALALALLLAATLYAGAPLKGVDVKLGKNPGGSPAARTTDGSGKFDFGVVPKGDYVLTIVLPAAASARTATPTACLIEIAGATGGPIRGTWDGAHFHTTQGASARSIASEKIALTADGAHAITGVVLAVN